LQEGQFSKSTSTTFGIKTVQGSIDHVVATSRENDCQNPTFDADGRLSWTLARQFRAYTKEDPKAVQEKALPICIIKLLALKKGNRKSTSY
jgi:hypothetical protein